jgi:hypothetical protein
MLIKLKKENDLKTLRANIEQEFVNQIEYIDDIAEVFDINAFYQRNKKYSKYIIYK